MSYLPTDATRRNGGKKLSLLIFLSASGTMHHRSFLATPLIVVAFGTMAQCFLPWPLRSFRRFATARLAESILPEFAWRAREGCWRPDVRDVEKISWGQPAKKKRTGSRGTPHRLNEEERRAFDQARRNGYLQVTGSAWRAQRRDAPLLNSYRSLCDARAKPMIVLHKLRPCSYSDKLVDKLVVDLSPLRLPRDYQMLELRLVEVILAEFGIQCESLDEILTSDGEDDDEEDANELRPIYHIPSHFIMWNVDRQQGKQIGKYLGNVFNTAEPKSSSAKKPKGNKPGKGRRSGGYGIG